MEIIYLPFISTQINDVVDEVKKHSPIIKITTFFDSENFIFTKYIPYSIGVTMVIECSNGNQLHITSCNCGYGGNGPHCTIELLKKIGVSQKDSKEVAINTSGFEITFYDSNQYVISYNTNVFESRIQNLKKNQINICNEKIYVNPQERVTYLYEPTGTDFANLFLLLKHIKVKEIEYYNSNIEIVKQRYNIPQKFCLHEKHDIIIIKSNEFNIFCIINSSIFVTVLNSIYYSVSGVDLYNNITINNVNILIDNDKKHIYNNSNIFSKTKLMLYIILNKQKPSHNIISFNDNGEALKWNMQ